MALTAARRPGHAHAVLEWNHARPGKMGQAGAWPFFVGRPTDGFHAPSPPKPYMNASRKTSGIGSVVAGLIDCVLISGLVCGLPGLPGEATGPDADTLTAASSGRRTLEVRGFGQAYAITV